MYAEMRQFLPSSLRLKMVEKRQELGDRILFILTACICNLKFYCSKFKKLDLSVKCHPKPFIWQGVAPAQLIYGTFGHILVTLWLLNGL